MLTFDSALNPIAAQNASNYTIIGPNGATVPVTSAVYNTATHTVSLHPIHQINLHWTYTLIVNGSSPTGVRGASGWLLDGAWSGKPGSNYTGMIDASLLVVTPTTPSAAIALKLSALRARALHDAGKHHG
jgi:hypothetical protein